MSYGVILVVLLLIVFVLYMCKINQSENFVARDSATIQRAAFKLFDESQGAITYTDFKVQLPETNAVSYRDYLSTWKSNR